MEYDVLRMYVRSSRPSSEFPQKPGVPLASPFFLSAKNDF
jgi:hypothetical protein